MMGIAIPGIESAHIHTDFVYHTLEYSWWRWLNNYCDSTVTVILYMPSSLLESIIMSLV